MANINIIAAHILIQRKSNKIWSYIYMKTITMVISTHNPMKRLNRHPQCLVHLQFENRRIWITSIPKKHTKGCNDTATILRNIVLSIFRARSMFVASCFFWNKCLFASIVARAKRDCCVVLKSSEGLCIFTSTSGWLPISPAQNINQNNARQLTCVTNIPCSAFLTSCGSPWNDDTKKKFSNTCVSHVHFHTTIWAEVRHN